ncbi:MAG: TonB-dependent receptor [Hydrogenovibrio sp.]|uniref:TonB-dependent receptor family protein n=1 Tax=Hydrogenovibrio sp. TaxID=2065821 RepID=UPI00286FBFAA|nr:TonB-dependent receptor [Hydrogenovibrio sp.]MDR9499145.1 TonB-dependent receptor [Hydrogenovibrio sp.]
MKTHCHFRKKTLATLIGLAVSMSAQAEVERLNQISIIGSQADVAAKAGSVQYLDNERLEQNEYTDIHRILREVPGVNVQEEEGFGLRPNIGIRGSGVSRSSNITLMEDGVLIAPAPYASPAAYYFPSAPRIHAVEVTKGPGMVQYGPRTLAGAVNLITRPIPFSEAGGIDVSGGQFGNYKLHGHYGASTETFGALIEGLRYGSDGFKDQDGGGDTGFDKNDFMAKFRINSGPDAERYQELNIKLGYADETSHMSYLGLTESDFDSDPYRRYAAAQEDVMNNDHKSVSVNHYIELNDALELDTTVYHHQFHRNWYKTDKVNGTKIGSILSDPSGNATALAVTKGEQAGTVDVKANNRDYTSEGVQSALGVRFNTGEAQHKMTVGARYHQDEMDRFQWVDEYNMSADGDMTLNSRGEPGSDSNRVESAKAFSAFVHDQVAYGKWGFQGGLRFETIDTERVEYVGTGRDSKDAVKKNSITAWVPGAGVTYQLNDQWQLLGGVHKGFAPASPGNNEADKEDSVNYELGARYQAANLGAEVIGFYNDFDNLLGECTAATGSGCDIGDQHNAGKVAVQGLEASLNYVLEQAGTRYPLMATYTYTDAEFGSSFSDGFWGDVEKGDKMSYLAPHQLYLSAGMVKTDWQAFLSAKYMDQMRTQAGSGSIPSDQKIDSHTVFDLTGQYNVSKDGAAYLKVDNLLDKEYMTARRPAGVRGGMPRTITVGYKMDF